jgi:hypothetical protein
MATPDLIQHLVSDLSPRSGAPIATRLGIITAATSLFCLALILMLFSKSAYFLQGPTLVIGVTAAGGVTLAAVAFWGMVRLSYPESRPELAWLIAPGAILLFGLVFEIAQMPRGIWQQRLIGDNPLGCFFSVLLLSLPILFAAVWGLRQGAPSRPQMSGAMAGLLAGGITVALYTIHCPEDSLLYIIAWHVPAVALLAGLGALLGNRYLRW